MLQDNIYALSTVPGKAGVAIVRIAGPCAEQVIYDLGYREHIQPRKAVYWEFRLQESVDILDCGLFIFFKGPNSFTGDDILELHLHGSIAVVNDMMGALSSLEYLRLAEPGEFSKRAFFNNKLDLTMAEGLADLIDAQTSVQRRVALRQYHGELEQLYDTWREKLVHILARMEAFIDFPEEDIPYQEVKAAIDVAHKLAIEINAHLSSSIRGEVITEGVHIVIFGPPNAGKSSLLNWLSQRDVAIVTDIAGTTRDVLQVRLDMDGFLTIFYDTAGLRQETEDVVEKQGIARALGVLEVADLKILMLDAANFQEGQQFIEAYRKAIDSNTICLLNKVDAADADLVAQYLQYINDAGLAREPICISLVEQIGLEQFSGYLKQIIIQQYSPSDAPIITKIRYRKALEECLVILQEVNSDLTLDVIAEEMRSAAAALGSITGLIGVEEILDEIFSTFCIGK